MKLLLDTSSLIWLLEQKDRRSFGSKAKQQLETAKAVYASSISIVEVRIKSMIGKLETRDDLLEDVAKAGCVTLSFSTEHADAITNFPGLTRHDPFDRMLLAQAKLEDMTLLTADESLLRLNLPYVVDARR